MVADKIQNIRNEELNLIFKGLMIGTYAEVLVNMLPIISSIVIFAVYVSLYGEESLTTAKVYTVISIFSLIALPMRVVVYVLINFINAKASLQRV